VVSAHYAEVLRAIRGLRLRFRHRQDLKVLNREVRSAVGLAWRRMLRMIPDDLLEILVCPVCKKSLTQKDNGQSLKCAECRRVYPVRDDIPILLVDEAVIDPS
jgi:uncharacterized protein